MRILQVVTDTDRRGAQVFATDLAWELARHGGTVETVALAAGVAGGLDVPVLGPSKRDRRTLSALRRRMRDADVVIAHGSTTLPACAVAGIGVASPIVYRQISDSRFWAPDLRRRTQTRLGLAAMDAIVALYGGSAEVLHDYLGVAEGKITVVPNGVPADPFVPADDTTRAAARASFRLTAGTVVLSLGALAPEKGVDRAVRAVAGLPDVQLLVAGAGPERAALEALAASLEVDARFVGSLTTPATAYAAADVLALPSRGGDSMPAVLIEAGLCGLPAATTDVAGIPEVTLDGRTGTVTRHDDDHAYEAALQAMLARPPAERAALGAAARAHCLERFTIEAVGRGWWDVLIDLVA